MMLPRTLFGRLLLIFIVFGVVMTGALLVVMQVSHRLYHREFDQTVNRELAQRYVASNFLLTDAPLNAETLHRGIGKLAAANPEVDIYLLDDSGGIVASSVPRRSGVGRESTCVRCTSSWRGATRRSWRTTRAIPSVRKSSLPRRFAWLTVRAIFSTSCCAVRSMRLAPPACARRMRSARAPA